jgi:hypothetical protein
VIQPVDHVFHDLTKVLEIEEQAGFIKLATSESHADFVVMSVRVFALALVVAEIVPRGKRIVDSDLVHSSPELARPHPAGTGVT